MSNPLLTPPAPEFVTTVDPTGVAAPAPSAGAEAPVTPGDAVAAPAAAPVHAARHRPPRPARRLPREARAGIAVALSIGLLVAVVAINRGGEGKKPPTAAIPGGGSSRSARGSGEPPAEQDSTPAPDHAERTADSARSRGKSGSTAPEAAADRPAAQAARDEKPDAREVSPPAVTEAAGTKDGEPPARPESTSPSVASTGAEPAEAVLPPVAPTDATTGAPTTPPPADVAATPPAVAEEPAGPSEALPPAGAAPAPVAPLPTAADTGDKTEVPAPLPVTVAGTPTSDKPNTPAGEPATDPTVASGGSATPLEPPANAPADRDLAPLPAGADPFSRPLSAPVPTQDDAAPPQAPPAAPPSRITEPEPITRTQSASPVFEPSGAAQAPAAGAVGAGWVTLPRARIRRNDDDRAAIATARADRAASRAPEKLALREDEDRIETIPHVVRPNENFWTISRLYYRDGRYYRALWDANRDKVPVIDKLYVNTTIRVPPVEALNPALIEPPKPRQVEGTSTARVPLHRTSQPVVIEGAPGKLATKRPAPGGRTVLPRRETVDDALPLARPAAEETASDEDESARRRRRRYQVRSRYETVRSIARATLGDAHRDTEILELNRNVIQDPFHLTPGQYLVLPDDARVGGFDR